ncbi:MAG TPA: class II D-tagatose-bisphosphate aldolase, non-catalytic subunit, partial [Thiolinea sp.]|nr:class II D-tagatose-bisphosphate aldolase, non-catalytic subunit [Thiolinea sp.]
RLGPNPWPGESSAIAMKKARTLVRQYVEAGFRKVHLDASMRCADDEVLSFAAIARRAAELCAVAERHAPAPEKLYYIMGTEVPVPGGETTEPDALDVTSVERFRNTLETHRSAFAEQGLDAAWERVVGIVTQPGVDFGHSSVFTFNPDAARSLSTAILDEPGRVFEAHSTDYQPVTALEALVEQHFFFLKVGPELTFRMREAIFALAGIESCLAPATPSHLPSVLDQAMTRNDAYWRDYYSGNPQALGLLKKYSYSDRIRYYWNEPDVQQALARLLDNLRTREMPQTCISQYFTGLAFGDIPDSPDALLERHIAKAISRYYQAAGFSGLPG